MTNNGAEKQKEQVLAVTVTSIEDASPNVKLVTLRVHAREAFSFRPGQWVDFYAPGVEKPGGYSIASSPGSFARDGTFVLAVRASRSSACGHWVHERCRKGDEARVRVGGKFFASREDLAHPLLLVAGGIGIAPLVGMLQTLVEEQRLESRGTRKKDTKSAELSPRAILLCSTKNPATQPMAGEVRAVAAKAGARCGWYSIARTENEPGTRLKKAPKRTTSTCPPRTDAWMSRRCARRYASCEAAATGKAPNLRSRFCAGRRRCQTQPRRRFSSWACPRKTSGSRGGGRY